MTSNVNVDANAAYFLDEIVAISPDRLAVKDTEGSLTYGELSARADRLARRLIELGVKPGDLVGLCLGRSTGLIVAALGIFRAGAAYVAIDPAYPDERLRWMLHDSAPAATIADSVTTGRLHDIGPTITLSTGGQLGRESPLSTAADLPP